MNQTTLQTKPTEPTLHLAIELSEKSWGLLFGDGSRTRAVSVPVGDVSALMEHARKARTKLGLPSGSPMVTCYEAGRDGFWVHRALTAAGVTSLVVDSTSIEVDQRRRRLKTDRVDAEKLLRLLVRFWGGEKEALRVVRVPSEQEEDARRRGRELDRLTHERTAHATRIKALLVLHGARGVKLKKLEDARTWSGQPLPPLALSELQRERTRLELVELQIKGLKGERETALEVANPLAQKVAALMRIKGIGSTSAWLFVEEFFGWRNFKNRRQVGAAAGLVSVPHNSGFEERDQGISKTGNRRVRTMVVQIAWGWLRWQRDSALSNWFHQKFVATKRSKRVGIVALARRVLIALWRYLDHGVVPEGAVLEMN